MTDYREILRLKSLGFNHTQIATSMDISRSTVVNVLRRAEKQKVCYQSVREMGSKELGRLLSPTAESRLQYRMPDYEHVHRELARSGMTLQLLWLEYCDKCREGNELPYQISQFKKHYQDFALKTKATMHLVHKPGETMQVDWAGSNATVVNDETGEAIKAYIFVAVLPYSGYTYAEAFFSMDQESWITAHVHAFNYFGGVPRIVVSDNLRTGVTRIARDEVVINKSYQEMAEHYQTAIVPTRVRAPKDKASVENAVRNVTSFILAAIRNDRFFSLSELNEVLRERLKAFNYKAFQKKEGSRATAFIYEKEFLIALPASPFELSEWKIATVQYNCHIGVGGYYYSVPFEYIKRKVDVRLTRRTVEVFLEGSRICSHARLYGAPGVYSTKVEHMPPGHQEYLQWNGERFLRWASSFGSNTEAVITIILNSRKVEQQSYRSCMALLKLGDQFTPQQVDAACAKALSFTPRPSFKVVQSILKSGKVILTEQSNTSKSPPSPHSFIRGADYYDRGRK